jgi:hypothetical protein
MELVASTRRADHAAAGIRIYFPQDAWQADRLISFALTRDVVLK